MQLKKETKGTRMKRQLYDCAIELFKSKGYDHVSVEEIVQRAGVAKGTFYIYFASKAQVVTTMLSHYDAYYEDIYAKLDPQLPIGEALDYLIAKSCEFTVQVIGRDLIRVLYIMELSRQGKAEELYMDRSLYRILKDLINKGQEKGEYRRDLPAEALTNLLVRSIRGCFFEWCIYQGNFDLSANCLEYTRMFRQSFLPV